VDSAYRYPRIRRYSTYSETTVRFGRRTLRFGNTNPLVRNRRWRIGLSKTGYIEEAGRCLVMQAQLSQRPVLIVLLDSWGKNTRLGDAMRIKQWMERPGKQHRG
jgi:D-alanyl-D-alanine endopeptidase (penicillin-binding protein 7)